MIGMAVIGFLLSAAMWQVARAGIRWVGWLEWCGYRFFWGCMTVMFAVLLAVQLM